LEMLKQTITRCPEVIWNSPVDKTKSRGCPMPHHVSGNPTIKKPYWTIWPFVNGYRTRLDTDEAYLGDGKLMFGEMLYSVLEGQNATDQFSERNLVPCCPG
jgi:hypothetical protein